MGNKVFRLQNADASSKHLGVAGNFKELNELARRCFSIPAQNPVLLENDEGYILDQDGALFDWLEDRAIIKVLVKDAAFPPAPARRRPSNSADTEDADFQTVLLKYRKPKAAALQTTIVPAASSSTAPVQTPTKTPRSLVIEAPTISPTAQKLPEKTTAKKRGRPRKDTAGREPAPKRPRGRPRKYPLLGLEENRELHSAPQPNTSRENCNMIETLPKSSTAQPQMDTPPVDRIILPPPPQIPLAPSISVAHTGPLTSAVLHAPQVLLTPSTIPSSPQSPVDIQFPHGFGYRNSNHPDTPDSPNDSLLDLCAYTLEKFESRFKEEEAPTTGSSMWTSTNEPQLEGNITRSYALPAAVIQSHFSPRRSQFEFPSLPALSSSTLSSPTTNHERLPALPSNSDKGTKRNFQLTIPHKRSKIIQNARDGTIALKHNLNGKHWS